ncbi:hypothetical protein [Nonomuraea sediminis]|uniref:hypothetical protein n=1 Tax=Nonomuraea sediminis TaxID=2835864 RepID=UPI001BDD5535|nr:hypothetical protein [Nonomuraea sediminis]
MGELIVSWTIKKAEQADAVDAWLEALDGWEVSGRVGVRPVEPPEPNSFSTPSP